MESQHALPVINQPCPIAAIRLQQKDGGFYCKSCHKTLVDFRSSSTDEIKAHCNKDICGIFTSDQVVTPSYSWYNRLRFAALTLLSVIGFQVSPLQAQQPSSKKTNIKTGQVIPILRNTDKNKDNPNPPGRYSETPKRPKKVISHRKKKRNKKYITYGCPAF